MIEIARGELLFLLFLVFVLGLLIPTMVFLTVKLREISRKLKGTADKMKEVSDG